MTTVRVIALVLAGLAVASVFQPVHGQRDSMPVLVGQRATLSYGARTIVDCTVVETRGSFVRCERIKPDPFSRPPAHTTWHNIATVESVEIRESER